MKHEVRSSNKLQYYSYISCHVDDILCIYHDQDNVLNKVNGYLPSKPGSVGIPKMSLDTKLKCIKLNNGMLAWLMSPCVE